MEQNQGLLYEKSNWIPEDGQLHKKCVDIQQNKNSFSRVTTDSESLRKTIVTLQ